MEKSSAIKEYPFLTRMCTAMQEKRHSSLPSLA